MKKQLISFRLLLLITIASFLLSSCGGGGVSSNEHLSSLPGISKKYTEEIDNLDKKIKESTDMEDAMKLDKKRKELKKEAENAINEFLANDPITNVPFEQRADYQFKISKVWVERASLARISYRAEVTITQDILNNFGNPPGFKKNFFAYVKAVDKEGKSLTRKYGVFMNASKKPFKTNMVVEMVGSLDDPADLQNFDKLIFISKEDYDNKN